MSDKKDQIKHLANILGLKNIANGTIPINEISEESLGEIERLFRYEMYLRDEKRYKAILGQSHLPREKLLEEFDLKFQTNITPDKFKELRSLDWMDEKENIVLMGGPGTGKTHLATALGYYAIREGRQVYYSTARNILFLIKTMDTIKKSRLQLGYMRNCDAIIIDELGYTEITKEEALMLYDIINAHNGKVAIIFITNRSFESWGKLFGDEVLASTLIDRIIERCKLINMGNRSYRALQQLKSKTPATRL